jgi:hypothetical protein
MMKVVQTIEQSVELGAALESAVIAVQPLFANGTSVETPPIKLTVGTHLYNVVISFSLAS